MEGVLNTTMMSSTETSPLNALLWLTQDTEIFVIYINFAFVLVIRVINLMSRVFANGPEGQGSIPGRDIPKTQKMALDAALFNTQHYKVRIKDKVEQWSTALPYTSV